MLAIPTEGQHKKCHRLAFEFVKYSLPLLTTCASCLLSAFVNQCLERSLMKLKDLVRA